ncbi:MAG TPA: metal ABC transporter ATP-binding protein [Beijerinckiaceae bacterium]|jgi:manganese/iron transport system ATP-binding protein
MSAVHTPPAPLTLAVENLRVVYPNGVTAIENADFTLRGGVICGLVGVNGSGKSTLFKTIMGFLRPARGGVRIAGLAIRDALRQGLVSYVPQSEDVDWSFPVLVEDVVMMGRYGRMGLLRRARAQDRAAVDAALARVGMTDLRKRQIGELSGGQKKRVFLARALAQGGRVVLLDEPFTGVDARSEQAIVALLREMRDEGALIFVSTHDLDAVPDFCDEVVLFNRAVVAHGPTDAVFTHDNLARAFGGGMRRLRARDAGPAPDRAERATAPA